MHSSATAGWRVLLNQRKADISTMHRLLPYPLFVLFSMISFNFTALALMLQLNFPEPYPIYVKIVAWLFAAVSWYLIYYYRNK